MYMRMKKLEPIVQCRNLSKIYKIEDNRIVAVQNVNLDIYKGEFVCIVGTSGSGKSTLLYLLAGIERPTKGQIRIAGMRLDKMTESELVKFRLQKVGFIFQAFNLFPYYSALDNVALPLSLRGVNSFERKRKAAQMLKIVGLSNRAKNRPAQMSGGQQQRVSIARALVTSPEILFADEPTGNLDSHTGEDIIRLMSDETKKQGKTLIMVTHDIEKAKYADRVIKVIDGEVVDIVDNTLEVLNETHEI